MNNYSNGRMWDEFDKAVNKIASLEEELGTAVARAEKAEAEAAALRSERIMLTLNEVRDEIALLATVSTQKDLAEKIGISPQYLHDILACKRMPGKRVLAFLKLRSEIVYYDVNGDITVGKDRE